MNSLFRFAWVCSFSLANKLSFSQSISLSHFYSPDSLPHPSAGKVSEWLCGAEWSAGVKTQQFDSLKSSVLGQNNMAMWEHPYILMEGSVKVKAPVVVVYSFQSPALVQIWD